LQNSYFYNGLRVAAILFLIIKLQSFTDVNFDGFDSNTIEQIKQDCLRFVHYEIGDGVKECELDGSTAFTTCIIYTSIQLG